MKQLSKQIILSMMTIVLSWNANAQVGIGTTTPNASAAFDITSTTQGFLPPRMTAAQRNSISAPVQGLMIYCTNCGTNGEAQLFNGTAWVNLVGGATSFGCGDNVTFTYNGSTVTYGTVIGANSKCWMDRNLGAIQVATSSTDASSYGDLFQWGRRVDGHQIRTSNSTTSLSNNDTPAGNFIIAPNLPSDWRSPKNSNLWQGVNGTNNPCPSGYRIPTQTEFEAERLSWVSTNASGAFASPLKLTRAGSRSFNTAEVSSVGDYGAYWSSTIGGGSDDYSFALEITSTVGSLSTLRRAFGLSVRCIKN